jgi:methylenetetrahydrofolate--tRNA-(uracil-5-)-methyltransferase
MIQNNKSIRELTVIGGGLAGCEASWQAAIRGVSVRLFEMRPMRETPAHKTGDLAELVCSNSFGSVDPMSAPGLLKGEMRQLHSLILAAADQSTVPAGQAMGIDRTLFSQEISRRLEKHPNITIIREEVETLSTEGVLLVATGPLTSDRLAESIRNSTQSESLYFFDAISPIIGEDNINMNIVFRASRYGKGGDDYLNCPMSEEEYNRFYDALVAAERVTPKSFENTPYFEACLPIEVLAKRGKKTPLFGPMKPVGLIDPKTGRTPFAVVQLRAENRFGSCYNMVGFQTQLKWPEQKRIFRTIPGLENAEFLRLGSMHRNTFINSPTLLSPTLQLKTNPNLFMAGQLVGVEGYVDSAAMGGLAGIQATRFLWDKPLIAPPKTTAHGALIEYITQSDPAFFQPMNINFGILPPLQEAGKRKPADRRREQVERAHQDFSQWIEQYGILADILK